MLMASEIRVGSLAGTKDASSNGLAYAYLLSALLLIISQASSEGLVSGSINNGGSLEQQQQDVYPRSPAGGQGDDDYMRSCRIHVSTETSRRHNITVYWRVGPEECLERSSERDVRRMKLPSNFCYYPRSVSSSHERGM
jgi:hypothetical protein